MQGEVLTASNITATINDHGILSGALQSQSIACTISDAVTIDGMIFNTVQISAELSGTVGLSADITIPDQTGGVPYSGEYTVTPTRETQTLQTAGMSMQQNVTINPIPSNYGLITWDGTTLTVS